VVPSADVHPLPPEVYRRRRVAALAVLALAVALLAGVVSALTGGGEDTAGTAGGEPEAGAAQAPPQLPRGGHSILPQHRVVAFYGAPQSPALGALGIGTPDTAARRLRRQAFAYRQPSRPALPALELIAVVAQADGGPDGRYRMRQTDAVIGRYLAAARRAKALLLLDIQPGRSDFFTEAAHLQKWLEQPDVGLALDPEWRMKPGQIPGQVIGGVGAREVNATSAWLAQVVSRKGLPEKLFVVHQFTEDMVDDRRLKRRQGLDMVLNADGFGGQAEKVAKYRTFTRAAPSFHKGFKLFYEEDTDLMSPREVLRLGPPPDLVVYE
jgi:hypothetical protein